MILRFGLALLLLGALLPGTRRVSAGPALTTPNGCVVNQGFTVSSDLVRACAVLRTYVSAYNQGDLQTALSVLDPSGYSFDCDFVWNQVDKIWREKSGGPARMTAARWLRDRFAEHDRFRVTIMVGGVMDDSLSPLVFGFTGVRSNDVLAARGEPPYDLMGSKGVLNDRETRILGMTLGDSTNCARYRYPAGASAERTRAVVQAFLDAYNAHDLPRVLQTLSKDVSYRDGGSAHRMSAMLEGKVAMEHRLRVLFRAGDVLGDPTLTIPDADRPSLAVVDAARPTSAGSRAQTIHVRVVFVLGGPHDDHIRSVSLSAR
ncbi:MAG TPA: hypothetical protein VFB58_12965 [Chloroflexota bacterium]|nr:hypothetical protein [Chloroflexota bacterium]